jgi:hypothetical protein
MCLHAVFVKGIPLISVINEEIGGDKFDPSSKAIVVEVCSGLI